jgi:hypothetical protein
MAVSGQFHAPVVLPPPLEKEPTAGWNPGAGMGAVEKRKFSYHCRELNAYPPDCSPSLYQLIYPGSIWQEVVGMFLSVCCFGFSSRNRSRHVGKARMSIYYPDFMEQNTF